MLTFKKRKFYIFSVIMLIASGLVFAKPYKNNVVCSYYADDFHGKKTSNGERFNMYSMTCAHKSLPFDTILKITNRDNGKSVQVRVNDRGPFVYAREVDLSKAAAVKLDMIKSGTAHCDIYIVKMGPDTKLSRDTAAKVESIMKARGETGPKSGGNESSKKSTKENRLYKNGTFWDIQIGSFSNRENANKLAQSLLKQGFKDVIFQKTPGVFRVVIRGVPGNEVNTIADKLRNFGYDNFVIKERKNKK